MTDLADKALTYFPAQNPWCLMLLAHGSGAGRKHATMVSLAEELSEQGIEVVSFDFDYMQLIEKTGKRRPPPRLPKLIEEMTQRVLSLPRDLPLLVGGKSMGGRVAASLLAQPELNLAGAVGFGYPFLPPKSKQAPRLEPLQQAKGPLLILQGERDPFGNSQTLPEWDIGQAELQWLTDADHDFHPRKRSGLTQSDILRQAAEATQAYFKPKLT
ncbi:alpha/beta family hydrolase [Paraferrimonas sedimenticola]|uniref:Alpha/beta hydrolase n=1 Tax=Paraferrimonas sedimenticola TaxID=375674 RepID=A0AA37RTX5_9GAMM|nr:alpha/beta family hydrolase [Paraferrimonas sedimenticola]GLP95239.1 alpha/beta hydrolase [Paraferrimonas sedimenticola]